MNSEATPSQTPINRQSNICGTNNGMYNVQSLNDRKFFILKEQKIAFLSNSDDEQFNSTIQVTSFFAWSILFLNSLFASFVPCWLMGGLDSLPFTRNSWRFTTVSILLIPFLLYQQRHVKEENEKLINCLCKQKLKPIFISTINYCVWLLLLVNACRWTSMNHAVCLSDLKILVTTLFKFKNNGRFHQFEVGGTMIAVFGIILLFADSLTLQKGLIYAQKQHYLVVQPWKRLLLGDGMAIIGSFASFYLDKYYVKPEMPRFTYLFIYNVFVTFNLITFGYFFGGSEFSFNTKFGIFGLYTYTNFVNVFYVSIMLGLTMIITNIFVRQIFSELIINVASRFQIVETAIIYHVLGLEHVPSGLTCLGYSFIVPGLVFILGGQSTLENTENSLNFQLYQPRESKCKSLTKSIEKQRKETNLRQQGKKRMPFFQILELQQNSMGSKKGDSEEGGKAHESDVLKEQQKLN